MLTHILLVEDNRDDAILFMHLFQRHFPKIKVKWMDDSEEALAFLLDENRTYHPEALVIDYKMPKLNGPELLAKLKTHPRTRALPTIIFSSSQEASDIDKCYQLGANSYLVKPINAQEFEDTILKLGQYWSSINQAPSPFQASRYGIS